MFINVSLFCNTISMTLDLIRWNVPIIFCVLCVIILQKKDLSGGH